MDESVKPLLDICRELTYEQCGKMIEYASILYNKKRNKENYDRLRAFCHVFLMKDLQRRTSDQEIMQTLHDVHTLKNLFNKN